MAQQQQLDLKVWAANGEAHYLKVKKSTKFREILVAYAAKAGTDPDTIHMTVDGQRVNPEECPDDYDMEGSCQIYCRSNIHAQRPRYEPTIGEIFGRLVPKRRLELLAQEPTASHEATQHPRLRHVIAGRSLPPGGLPKYLLQKLLGLGFLVVDDVHAEKGTSFCWRETGRSAIARGWWKPVNFVAVRGERLMRFDRTLTASEHADCRTAWARDPSETLRILFTWDQSERPLTARFLAIVEPSLDGLERIVMLCEPAHRFVYAKHELNLWWGRGDLIHIIQGMTIDVIRQWAQYIGTPVDKTALASLPEERRNLVISSVFRALGSWADAAVAADFFFCFFSGDDWEVPVPDLAEARDWDGGKASAFAAAHVAHVAALRHGHDYSPYEFGEDGFSDAADRMEELIELEQRLGAEEFDARVASFGMSWQNGITRLVEHASEFPGKFYDLY